jgi:diguanylate cyclase (GGDEF)-like protein
MSADTDDSLSAALLDSRTRWRDLALLGADLLFEVDAAGRLAFLAPEPALGHAAMALLGQPAALLRADPDGPDPFDPAAPARGMRAWLQTGTGGRACLEVTAIRHAGGLRGVARDVTAEEARAEATARLLRRATALVRLFGIAERGRAGEAAAEGALGQLLDGLRGALGCQAAAILEADGAGHRIAARAGPFPCPAAADVVTVLAAPGLWLAVRRETPPDAEEVELLRTLGPAAAALAADAARQRALAAAARTDPLTGLLNRRGFAESLEAGRARHGQGVIAYLDMDGLKRLNDRYGHAAGDAAIRAMAARLAGAIGPEESAARLGGDEFALWLPGLDEAGARLRCTRLGMPGALPGWPEAGPEAVAASIGFAAVAPGDAAEALLARADAAMYGGKRQRRAA